MNFLAHLYLSGEDPAIRVGNFLGDFVKGRETLKTFEPGVVKGINLHRGIDVFTDTHPIVQNSKNRLRPKYRHYSGVIVDMFYDYYLGSNWAKWHPGALTEYAAVCYRQLKSFEPIMPEEARRVLPYIIRGDWLTGYSTKEGIHAALSGMARRTLHDSKMNEAIGELNLYDSEFQKEFDDFFPELRKFASDFLERN